MTRRGHEETVPRGKVADHPVPEGPPREALVGTWRPALKPHGKSKSVALCGAIREGISSGQLTPGMRLPPQRDMADYFGVAIATVTKAVSLAMGKGYVVAKTGSGTFIADPKTSADGLARVPALQDLSLNAPPASIVEDILRDNLREIAQESGRVGVFDYDPIPGEAVHRSAACQWLAMRGLTITPDSVLVTQGAHEALLACLSAITQPGDCIACEHLTYTGLRRIGQLLRIRLIGIDLDDEGLSEKSLGHALRQHAPKAIVCTPVTQNPTTVTYTAANRRMLCKLAGDASIPVIEDDIYGLLAADASVPPLMARAPDNTILITSLSKTVAAGLRVGYVTAGERLLPRIRDSLFNLGWTAPSLQMSFATRLVQSGRARLCVERHREEASQRVSMVRGILGRALLTRAGVRTYHVWVRSGQVRPDDLSAELYRDGIQVSPASHFHVGDGPVPHALRLSLGRVADRAALVLPLQRVAHRISQGTAPAIGSIA